MITRTPEDICLLCQSNTATKTGSHMVPASLVASAMGERDKEAAFRINPSSDAPVYSSFGRGNLKNDDPTPKQIPYVKDYVFCPDCESKLAVLENELNPVLTAKIKSIGQTQNFPKTELSSGTTFVTCIKVNPDLFRLYILSLIWRLDVLYYLEKGKFFLKEESEMLRRQLTNSMGFTVTETLRKFDKNINSLQFVMCGCIEEHDETTNHVTPHPHYVQPYCFLINNYIIVFGFTQTQLETDSQLIHLKDFNVNKQILNTIGPIKIVLTNAQDWTSFTHKLHKLTADNFKEIRAGKLRDKIGFSIEKCNALIMDKAKEIHNSTGKEFSDCYDEAYKFLMTTL